MRKKVEKKLLLLPVFLIFMLCASCGSAESVSLENRSFDISEELQYDSSMELDYATQFAVDYYKDGFVLITITDGSRFLLNTKEQELPAQLDSDIKVLPYPVTDIYLVASATMDMFCTIDAQSHICLSGTEAKNWYIPEAKEAMENGSILYAGKYSAPDYELIASKQCKLAIESTMIKHSPDVKEKLEGFGVPVLVDYSSYEEHPLGRTEWVKLYGLLTGNDEKASQAFEEQKQFVEQIDENENLGKTVAFFYITSNESVSVRKTGDYVPKMISMAGGSYIFENLDEPDNDSSSMNMQMEEFYAKAKEADVLIYNSTVDGALQSIDDLLEKSSLLADFKAVKEGNVWCTTQNLYQDSMDSGQMIQEINTVLTMEDAADEATTYLYKLE